LMNHHIKINADLHHVMCNKLKKTLNQTWLGMIQQQSVKLYTASIFQR
jgi:hypothetical protein